MLNFVSENLLCTQDLWLFWLKSPVQIRNMYDAVKNRIL